MIKIIRALKNIDKEKLSLSKDYLARSKKDLEDAKTLYEVKSYSNAIYHIQQSVEKSSKSFYIIFSNKSINDTRKELKRGIGHKSILVFTKLIKQFVDDSRCIIDIVKELSNDVEFKTDIEELERIAKDYEKIRKIANLSKEEIEHFLEIISNIRSKIKESIKDMTIVLDMIFEMFGYKGVRFELIIDSVLSTISLYFISAITFPHESFTRYPDGSIKPDEYNEKMGIVKKFPDICNELDYFISSFEKYLDIMESKVNKYKGASK